MSCALTYAIPLDCISSIGGLKGNIYLGVDVNFGTLTYSNTTGEIQAISGATGDTGSMYEFQVAKDVAHFNETWAVSNTNGTAHFTQALSFNLQKMSPDKRNQLNLLVRNRNIKAIFEDNNGVYWVIGLTRGAVTTAGTAASGTAVGDLNGYTITLTADEPNPAYAISPDPQSVFTGIDFNAATSTQAPA
jgi:hypothetical protein